MVRAILYLAVVVSAGWVIPAYAASGHEVAHPKATRRHAPRHAAVSRIEDRVRTLSKGLGLDLKQEAELRKVLERQREQVQRVWKDPALPGRWRVSATLAIDERTADEIRALLNDEQRKKYNPPRQRHEQTSDKLGVEAWMDAMKPR
jgi:hypothetical protein